eukprot:Ihof_evm2s303 gene=Ihof_evmTU2s303
MESAPYSNPNREISETTRKGSRIEKWSKDPAGDSHQRRFQPHSGTVGHVCACLANAGRRHKSTANNVLQIERNLGSTAALAGPAEFLELANARRQAQPNEKSRSFFRRSLPEPPAIAFAKPEGKRIFSEALSDGTMECFFPLIEQFRTQDEPSFCGLAALTMVLNALAIDPKRTWKGPWRWFHERMLDCCSPVEVIEKKGIVFRQLACLARCNGALVKDMQANETTEAQFREDIMASCTGGKDMGIVLVSYSRKEFLQTGDGHYSPIGGYHRPTDSVLILDVARFKYPPHWVPLHSLWNAMNRIDPDTTKTRGYMVLKKQEDMVSLVFTMSRPRGNCRSSLRNLDHSVTSTVMSAYKTATTDGNVTNNTTLIKSFLTHIPDNLKSMLSTYNTEYNLPITEGPKEYQEAAETLLTDIRRLPLYNLVMDVVRLGLPPAPPPSPA